MGVLSTNRAQISSGGLISASFVSDVYDVLTGATSDTPVITGTLSVSGSLTVSTNVVGSFTGSLQGTATSASFATTSSYVSATNVDGTVANASTASYVAAANVDGTVANATTAVSASFVTSTLVFKQLTTLPAAVNGALAVSSSGDLYLRKDNAWNKVSLV